MNKMTLLGILLFITFGVYGQIYKWVDDQGVIHFSDHPHQGSQTVTLPEVQSYSAPTPQHLLHRLMAKQIRRENKQQVMMQHMNILN